jgi:Leucine-rich repeat (LRR) protein
MTKKLYCLLFCALAFVSSAQNCTFADSYLKDALMASDATNTIAKNLEGNYCKIDADNDGEIQESEAAQIKELEIISASVAYFDGLSNFTNLESLNCTNNGRLNTPMGSFKPISLDLSEMPNLRHLTCQNNQLYLGIGSFIDLEELDLYHCRGFSGTLDFTAFANLTNLNCGRSNLAGINIDGLSGLQRLDISFNDINSFDFSAFPHLRYLNISFTPITSLDVSGHTELEYLNCQNSEINELNINGCSSLREIDAMSTWLVSVDASNLPQLQILRIESGELNALTVSGSTNLETIVCDYGHLTELDASNLPNLTYLSCLGNLLTTLNVGGSLNLEYLSCGVNQLTSLDCRGMSHLNYLECAENPLTELYIKNGIVEEFLYITTDTSLDYICADAEQVADIQTMMVSGANPDCVVDSACAALQTRTFSQTDSIAVYPNPANNILNIESDATVSQIDIYNTLGQLVLTSDAKTSIDISRLQKGSYFLKLTSDAGTTTKQFLKN